MIATQSTITRAIRDRRWYDVARIEGRSVHAVRDEYDPTYEDRSPAKQFERERLAWSRKFRARMRDLDMSYAFLVTGTGMTASYVRDLLDGLDALTPQKRDRLEAAFEKATNRLFQKLGRAKAEQGRAA